MYQSSLYLSMHIASPIRLIPFPVGLGVSLDNAAFAVTRLYYENMG